MQATFEFSDMVKLFPQEGGWHYVSVAREYSEATKILAERGLVAITATIGDTSWDTSLLPMGDGTHIIALPLKVRKSEHIQLDQIVTGSFVLRER